MKISVKLFGAFRNLNPQTIVTLDVIPDATVAEVKTRLQQELGKDALGSDVSALMMRSVLADEDRILDSEDRVNEGMKLAVLPPVCGG